MENHEILLTFELMQQIIEHPETPLFEKIQAQIRILLESKLDNCLSIQEADSISKEIDSLVALLQQVNGELGAHDHAIYYAWTYFLRGEIYHLIDYDKAVGYYMEAIEKYNCDCLANDSLGVVQGICDIINTRITELKSLSSQQKKSNP